MKFLKVKSPLWLLVLSLFAFLVFDNLIFRSGLYLRYVSIPENSTALHLQYALDHDTNNKPKILMIGNSGMYAAFNVIGFQENNPQAPFEVIPLFNRGVGLQVQYHLLQEIDPDHRKYKAIIIPLESYKMLSGFDQTNNNDYRDALEIGAFLKAKEWPSFLQEYKGTDLYQKLLLTAFAYDRLYSDDLTTLLPTERWKQNFIPKEEIYRDLYDGSGHISPLSGLKLNAQQEIVSCPFSAERCEKLKEQYGKQSISNKQKQLNAQKLLSFEKKWLTKIVTSYQNSPTQILFIKLPHTAFSGDRSPLPNAPNVQDILPKQDNVHFLDQNYFEDLSQFKYMSDSMHLTTLGCAFFTKRITPILYKLAEQTPNVSEDLK